VLGFLKKRLLQILENRGYCISFGEPATFQGIVSAFNSRSSEFFFVQIGAYDGKDSDPLHGFIEKFGWNGILVEPQPEAFARLKCNYAGRKGLVFENAAIAGGEGLVPMYRLKDSCASLFPKDHGMLSSFSADHILKHLSEPRTAEQVLETIEVPCLSLSGLFAKYKVAKIDLLQIDAEGCDYEIIRSIPFDRFAPQVIRFEHAHLDPPAREECIQLLLSHSYKIVVGAYDITAFRSRWMYD